MIQENNSECRLSCFNNKYVTCYKCGDKGKIHQISQRTIKTKAETTEMKTAMEIQTNIKT